MFVRQEQRDHQKVKQTNIEINQKFKKKKQQIIIFRKGVCISHAALLDCVENFHAITSNDVLLTFSSLYWISGWFVLLTGILNGATRILTTETYNPILHLRLIEQYKVTFSKNAAHHLSLMLKCDRFPQTDLSSIKFQAITGGKCSFSVQNEINARLPNGMVCPVYGLSESAGPMTFNLSDTDSVGQLIGFFSIKIIDDDGNRCGIGKNGEICFKTNYKFLGYYDNQKATLEALDDEGFFLTADIGHFDENGNLYIVDRKKDLIKYCGHQISPSQIESYLIAFPAVKAACIIGIPNDVETDLPAAFIVRNEGSNITETDIFNKVSGKFHLIRKKKK